MKKPNEQPDMDKAIDQMIRAMLNVTTRYLDTRDVPTFITTVVTAHANVLSMCINTENLLKPGGIDDVVRGFGQINERVLRDVLIRKMTDELDSAGSA